MKSNADLEEDQYARQQALNPTHSFIVQAPAGSGKTELLSQRYLCLLSKAVKSPEEIVAITFTRKAASEMRERVLSALLFANTSPEPSTSYKKTTWQLAKNVLDVDKEKSWNLLKNPNRLRIITIDSLSAMISAHTPLLSGFGAQPTISEDIQHYYQLAIEEILDTLHTEKPWSKAIETLLLHLDNNAEKLSSLLKKLLAKRDQWLPHIMTQEQDNASLKDFLEAALYNIVQEALDSATKSMPKAFTHELQRLAQFAGENLTAINPKDPISQLKNIERFPTNNLTDLEDWLSISSLLLTKKDAWRKTVDKRCGFPADKKLTKKSMLRLLNEFSQNDTLKNDLINIRYSPPLNYTKQQWCIINALIQLLPVLVAQLTVIFRRHGVIDFTELTLGALRALGDEQSPTDLALYLDYQIHHLLIDEFQDTSVIQFTLLEQLIAEWGPNDGRSLFLVGDPMQSIYRFRNAEVGLFLRAQQEGIANIKLRPLRLRLNFRSDPTLINWLNQTFSSVFPQVSDIPSGAVSYNSAIPPALPEKQEGDQAVIGYYAAEKASPNILADKVVDIVQKCPKGSIAILVRSRSQLKAILPALHLARLPFNAIEIEALGHRMEVLDLVSLTRALLHLGDRIAWLSILRAPWCGLTLKDLHAVSEAALNVPLWKSILSSTSIAQLSDDGAKRIQRIKPILHAALENQGRQTLTDWIKGSWVALGGPACLSSKAALKNTQSFFNLLITIEKEFNLELLENKLKQLYADAENSSDTALHIMTIHKSKGLEFDHVLLPELHKKSPSESNQLLMWLERINADTSTDLVLAPIKSAREQEDPIHAYLKLIEAKKIAA